MVGNLFSKLLSQGIQPLLYGAIGALIALTPGIAIAQTQAGGGSVNPLQDFNKRDSYDPFSSNGSGGVTPGIFDLIHRASQGFNNTPTTDQNQALDSAALEFRNQQKKRFDPSDPPSTTMQATPSVPTTSASPSPATQPQTK